MLPGTHVAVVSRSETMGLLGRLQGWELRDTLLVLMPGPTNLFIYLFRVPLEEKTIAAQVLKTGTGGLNIDECRIGLARNDSRPGRGTHSGNHGKELPSLSADWGAWVTTKGRWPSNLLLIHHLECVSEGIKRVKGSAEGAGKLWSHYRDGKLDQAKAKKSYIADTDGLEAIPAWSCHPSCPVKLLDEQSGALMSGTGSYKKETSKGHQANAYGVENRPSGTQMISYGDSGGASRFFPQFKNLAECLDWINHLINSS